MACLCQDEQCPHSQFESELEERRHFGEVSVSIALSSCNDCGFRWIQCEVEDTGHAAWNRWYRAPALDELTDWSFEQAAGALIVSSWHFYGGPYYHTSGERAFGAAPIKEVLITPPTIVEEFEPKPFLDDSVLFSGMGALA